METPVLEILLVEDDAADAELALRASAKANIANPVVHARNAHEALRLLRDRASRGALFALVLLDLHLPGMSGLALLEIIKQDEFLQATPVVVLTSVSEDPVIERCYALGADGFALKPVRFDTCHAAVKQLQLSWLIVSESELRRSA